MQERRGVPGQLPSAFTAFHPASLTSAESARAGVTAPPSSISAPPPPPPLPPSSLLADPRFFWDPARLQLHSHLSAAGLSVPSIAELSLLQRSVELQAAALRAQQAQLELYGAPTPPLSGLSAHHPLNTSPLPPSLAAEAARGLACHDYLSSMSTLGQRSLTDYHAPSSLVGSDFSLNLDASSRLSLSPRHGRKRPLSSALSDSFDLGSMIRFSPTSLLPLSTAAAAAAAAAASVGSRCSSAASGSYGHLSAGASALSPSIGLSAAVGPAQLQQLQAQLLARGSPYLPSAAAAAAAHAAAVAAATAGVPSVPLQPTSLATSTSLPTYNTGLHLDRIEEQPKVSPDTSTQDNGTFSNGHHRSPAAATTVGGGLELGSALTGGANMVKREATSTSTSAATPERLDEEPPEDFVVTHCDWEDCGQDFDTQIELVKHVNNEHVSCNRKSFRCLWRDCPREQKPFKAQYMLVVHVRTHTGDKPNKCSFEGCNKRYSRLENLKTHLRSHTGEKPYSCEFPGCSKAFSNASDRAKHQNRTHSSEKPYVCKVPGCTKRYTDPSSLRKHVKTVHGPEFYKNKRHKGFVDDNGAAIYGTGSGASPLDSPAGAHSGSDEHKITSASSPSVRSDEGGSPCPANQLAGSPAGHVGGAVRHASSRPGAVHHHRPISDNNVSTTHAARTARSAGGGSSGRVRTTGAAVATGGFDAVWEVAAGEQDVVQAPIAVLSGVFGEDGAPQMSAHHDFTGRAYRPRIQAKAGLIPHGMRTSNVSEINYRLQHLRMTAGAGGFVQQPLTDCARRHSYKLPQPPQPPPSSTSLQFHHQQQQLPVHPHHLTRGHTSSTTHLLASQQHAVSAAGGGGGSPLLLADPRRDSAATASSYYGSMSGSGGGGACSRRVSQMSSSSTAAAVGTSAGTSAGSYAPLSDAALRRCSQLSAASSGVFSGAALADSRRGSLASVGSASAGMGSGAVLVSPDGRPLNRRYTGQLNHHQHQQQQQQQQQFVDANLVMQPQHMNMAATMRQQPGGAMVAAPGGYHLNHQHQQMRRASDPVYPMHRQQPAVSLHHQPCNGALHLQQPVHAASQMSARRGSARARFDGALQQLCEEPATYGSEQPLEDVLDYLQQTAGATAQRSPVNCAVPAAAARDAAPAEPADTSFAASATTPAQFACTYPTSYGARPTAPSGQPSPAIGGYGQMASSPSSAAASGFPSIIGQYGDSSGGGGAMPVYQQPVHTCGHVYTGREPADAVPAVCRQPCPSCQRRQLQWAAGCMPPELPQQQPAASAFMSRDSYSRTLNYVQRCRQWSPTAAAGVRTAAVDVSDAPASDVSPMDSASNVAPNATVPASGNMVVHSMSTAMDVLAHENRYLKM